MDFLEKHPRLNAAIQNAAAIVVGICVMALTAAIAQLPLILWKLW